jgi:hypothetical protein
MRKFFVSCVSAIMLAGCVVPADADTFFKRRRPNFFEKLLGIDNSNSNVGTFEGADRVVVFLAAARKPSLCGGKTPIRISMKRFTAESRALKSAS